LSPAAEAFDAIAPVFDDRFGAWLSVRAQRNAVRGYVQDVLSSGSHILEIGGGTGEDAQWFVDHGYRVHLTDASPTMVARAREKLTNRVTTEVLPAESFATWTPDTPFDAAFSNFAALNCVDDLAPFARGLAGALRT